MSRLDQEDTSAFNTHFKSGKFSHSRKILTDNVSLTQNGSLVNFFDAGGSDRDVTLPAFEDGRFYVVGNIGTADSLIVKDASGGTVTSLLAGDTALMFASDLEWVALRGWAALGVFTNTVNGLVPAPNSLVPGSLFLRDDGQWGQVQVTGIVDAFKFITDGVNTAIGSGPDTFWIRSSTNKVGITVTNGEAVFGDNVNLTVNEAQVNHDLLLNFFADEHVGHSLVSLTAGVGLSGGGDISASRTFNLDLNDLTTDTPVLADTFGFYDVSGTDTNKATFTVLNGILDHNALLNYVANRHIDHSAVSITASTGLTGGGDITTTRSLALDINGLVVDTPVLGDSIPFYDLSGGDINKTTLTVVNGILDHNALLNYVANRHIDHTAVALTAGAGLTGGGDISASRTFDIGAGVGITVNANDVALNINGLTADTLAVGDFIPFFDLSGSDTNKISIANLNAFLSITALSGYVANQHIDHTAVSIATGANSGLSGGGTIAATRNLSLDINSLTADASPVAGTDYVATWDASASLHKKVLINNLPSGLNMTGHRGHLAGLTLSTAGASATFGIAVGEAANSTNTDIMSLASAYTKTTAAWAVGTGNGALDTGSIANSTWYHVHLIKRPDTGVTDILVSLSATAPTLPANYTLFRRIGSMLTNGSAQWVKFVQLGDEFLWDVIVNNANTVAPGTSGTLYTLTIPTGVQVNALGSALWYFITAGTYLVLSSPDITGATVTASNATLYSNSGTTPNATLYSIRSNTSGQIRARADGAGGGLYLNTIGWIDRRGRDS